MDDFKSEVFQKVDVKVWQDGSWQLKKLTHCGQI